MSTQAPAHIRDALEGLASILERSIHFEGLRPVSGGCINQCFAVDTDAGRFFLKQQERHYPGFFAAEAAGLALLKGPGKSPVPAVLAHADRLHGPSWLWLEWLASARPAADADAVLGRRLARMHAQTAVAFGRPGEEGPFYLATLLQDNRPVQGSWGDFFRQRRLPDLMAACGNLLPVGLCQRLEHLAARLEERVPVEAPALIHGDLWSGNKRMGPDGHYAVLDPAPLYGHRESDLAMMQLFGGFGQRTYSAYREAFPLQPGWQERVALFQLEPLLVHVALFGRGYVGQLEGLLDRLKA
jgi:fructosamine-3-kinase